MEQATTESDLRYSFDSGAYLKLVASHVLTDKSDSNSVKQLHPVDSFTSLGDHETKVCYCVCKVCRERRKTSICKETQYQVEFQLHGLKADDKKFVSKMIKHCRKANLSGYIIYTYEREDATGVMAGAIKDINEVKDWLLTQNNYIPEPMNENIYFSWFLVSRKPSHLQFDERVNPPQSTEKSLEFGSSD